VVKILLILVLFCGGCCNKQILVKPLPPPHIERPTLAITQINKDTTDSDVVKSYRITVEQLIGYSKQLEIIINGYSEQSK
jgi:hypothetical protein